MIRYTGCVLAVLMAGAVTVRIYAQDIAIEAVEVAAGVYVFIPDDPGIGTCTAIVRESDVVIVDTMGTPHLGSVLVDHVRNITELPVRFVVNTHWHDDHVWGNQAFAQAWPDAVFIAHEATRLGIVEQAAPALQGNIKRLGERVEQRAAMLERGLDAEGQPLSEENRSRIAKRNELFRSIRVELMSIKVTLPTVTITGDLTLHGKPGEEVYIRVLGRGHSAGDVVVEVPGKCVVVGDLLTLPFPAAAEAFPRQWIETLRRIDALDAPVIVIGHGTPQTDESYLHDVIALLNGVVAQTETAAAQGRTIDEITAAIDVGAFASRLPAGDERMRRGFDMFFLRPAIESVLRNMK